MQQSAEESIPIV